MPGGRYIDLANPVSDSPLNSGLASWWLPMQGRLGNRLFDIKGNRNATFTNTPTWRTNGFDGPALYFDSGSSQQADFSSYSSVTVWTWVFRFRRTGDASYHVLAGHSSETSKLMFNPSGAQLFIVLTHSGPSQTVTVPGYSNDSWTCLSVARNGATAAELTANFASNFSLTNPISGSASWSRFGNGESGGHFNGAIAEARYYNRYLTYAERLAVHDQMVRGNPDTLRRWSRKTYAFLAGGGGGGGGTSGNLLLLGVG